MNLSRVGELQHRYTNEERQKIIDLWVRSSMSSGQIGHLTGMRRNQIMGLCNRYMKRKNFPSRGHLQGQCMETECADWWDQGPVFAHNVTPKERNRASGLQLRSNRQQGVLRKQTIRAKSTSVGKGQSHQRPQISNALSAREQAERKEAMEARAKAYMDDHVREHEEAERIREGHEFFSEPVDGEPTSILDLRYGMCRAVVGEHPRIPGGMYCGSKVSTRAYCREHHQLFYTKRERTPHSGISRMGMKTPTMDELDA